MPGGPGHRRGPRGALKRALDFSPREWRLLLPLTAAGFFEQYDLALLSLAAPVLADGLGVSIATFGIGVAIVRLGALGGLPVLRLADRVGRRQMLIWSLLAFTLLTGLTALAWSLAAFVVVQTLARIFLAAEHNLSSLVIVEEIRPDRRGAALSVLGWLSTTGPGAVAALIVIVPLTPLDWRLFYLVALAPLAVVAWLRRGLGETQAFQVAAERSLLVPGWWPRVPARSRGDLWRITALIAACGAVQTPMFVYAAELAQDGYGWEGRFTLVVIASGLATMAGFWFGGRATDRIGRRPGLVAGLALTAAAAILTFTEVRALFVPGWFCLVASYACLQAASLAYIAELFPTALRATLGAFAVTGQIVSGSVGLVLVGVLDASVGSSAVLMALGFALVPFVLLVRRLPETVGADVVGAAAAA